MLSIVYPPSASSTASSPAYAPLACVIPPASTGQSSQKICSPVRTPFRESSREDLTGRSRHTAAEEFLGHRGGTQVGCHGEVCDCRCRQENDANLVEESRSPGPGERSANDREVAQGHDGGDSP